MNVPLIIFVLLLFSILMISFSQDKVDYFPVALVVGAVAIFGMQSFGGLDRETILGFINFETLIFIFSMQIIIYFASNDNVLEFIVIKIIHFTRGNNRLFFYLICFFTATLVAFIEDLTLSLILVPLIYRTTRILKVPAGTYMMGMTISINIGAILTPVSSLKNLIIGHEFNWGFIDYFVNMGPLFIITLILTVVFLDQFILKKEVRPSESDRRMLLKVVDPGMVIKDRRNFKVTFVTIIVTFGLMILDIPPSFVSVLSAAFILLMHWKSFNFSDLKKDVELKIIIVFGVLFILANSLSTFGFSDFMSDILLSAVHNNIFLAVLMTLVISSLLSAFLAGTPVTIILLPIFSSLVKATSFPSPIIIAFISGVNLAGNFLPQGSACDMLTLSLASKYNVPNLNYKRLLRVGSVFASLHFLLVLGYTMLYTLFLV
ncbi:MAG: SLC13 family permease [Promethearchaeota archaeon]